MNIQRYKPPKSSFISIEKDLGIITSEMLKNERLKRLLHYTTSDAMHRPNLTQQESVEMLGKEIKLVPKLYIDGSVLNYIIISFDNFVTNRKNPEFRDNIIEFDIICHFDQWQLENFQLRPYRIAAELDEMFDDTKLTGIGELHFAGASQILLTDEYAGLCLMYEAIHGEEDKKPMATLEDQAKLEQDWEEMYK